MGTCTYFDDLLLPLGFLLVTCDPVNSNYRQKEKKIDIFSIHIDILMLLRKSDLIPTLIF